MSGESKCTELAKVIIPWGGELLSYCPVHANNMVMLSNAMGSPIQARRLAPDSTEICECPDPLTEEEQELAKQSPI